MSDLPYMPLYVKDIFADTVQLSDAEFTVYHKLLYAMWLHGGSVPDDDRENARLTGRTLDKYRRAKARLMPLLIVLDDGRLSQKRLISEYRLALSRNEKNAANANTRWASKANKNNDISDANGYAKQHAKPMHRARVPEPEPYIEDTSLRSASSKPSSLRSDGSAPAEKPTPKTELASVLDDVHVKAVIDHRQRIRKPLTAHAARLLAGKFARCPDANAAADAMVANGWQGFEPEWMENRHSPNGSRAPPGFRTSDGILAALKRKLDEDDETSHQPGNHQDADYPLLGLAAKRHDRE